MIVDKEYTSSIDQYKKPKVINGQSAIGYRLMELITMNPGDNPLHPEMGVGLRNFRYSVNTISKLQERIKDQIDTYLPMYIVTDIALVISPDKILSIEIAIGPTTFVYDTADTDKPVTIDDLTE
jgi:hypothetical protein